MNHDPTNDPINLGGAASDDAAFVAHLTDHQGLLHAYLNTLLPGDPEVSDIVQKSNLVIWNKRANFLQGSDFRAWVLSIAYWEARSWMTTRKRKAWLIFDEELVHAVTERFTSFANSGDDHASDEMDALRCCLSKLRESDRLLVVNHYQHHKSLAECSQILGRSRDALKLALFRTRAALKRCIESQLGNARSQS